MKTEKAIRAEMKRIDAMVSNDMDKDRYNVMSAINRALQWALQDVTSPPSDVWRDK